MCRYDVDGVAFVSHVVFVRAYKALLTASSRRSTVLFVVHCRGSTPKPIVSMKAKDKRGEEMVARRLCGNNQQTQLMLIGRENRLDSPHERSFHCHQFGF